MISRRKFLAGGAVAAGSVALGGVPALAAGGAKGDVAPTDPDGLSTTIPFEGRHQAGVLLPPQDRAIIVSFDAIAGSPDALAEGIASLSDRARKLTVAHTALLGAPGGEGPTPDSGLLGPRPQPDALTVTIGFGASMFDSRYGLAARRPDGLKKMPVFPDDDIDPAQAQGDVLLQLCSNHEDTAIHALRDLMAATRDSLALRWKVEGFRGSPRRESGARRNLLGFKDGTANPDTSDETLMNRLIWTSAGRGGRAWTADGTFAVVRLIRNRVEFWDRVSRGEQELMIGRDKAGGAPLGKAGEQDDPEYGDDPKGDRIPLDAHIRLARPRTPETEDERILRRGYNYSNGVDQAGQLDMGLAFVGFNRDLEKQFEVVQRRLAGEPLVDYIKPVGGGYFFLPAGAQGTDDWVGSGLFT